MKRIALGIIFIICLVMCLGFVGCGENNDPIETTTAEKEINTVPTTIAYEVFTEEDMTYIKFIEYEEKSSINVGMPFPLEFQTPYEMKDTLTNRKLTQEQLTRLARYMGGIQREKMDRMKSVTSIIFKCQRFPELRAWLYVSRIRPLLPGRTIL